MNLLLQGLQDSGQPDDYCGDDGGAGILVFLVFLFLLFAWWKFQLKGGE